MLPSRVTRETLDVPLAPGEAARRLASSMAHVKSLLFTPTWGLSEDFVGRVDGNRFRMRARHAYSNGYTRLLFGTVEPSGHGSRVKLEFRDVRFVVWLMNVVTAVLVLTSLAYLGSIAHYASSGGTVDWNAVLAGIAGPGAVLLVFLVVEIIGRRLGRRDEHRMREHLEAVLSS